MPFQALQRFGKIERFDLANRLAALDAFQNGQFAPVASDQLAPFDQDLLAFGRVTPGPASAVERFAALENRKIDVFGTAGGDGVERGTGGRIDRLERVAGRRGPRPPVDEGPRRQRYGVGQSAVFVTR